MAPNGKLIDIQRTDQPTFRLICFINGLLLCHTKWITRAGVNAVSTKTNCANKS
jgi:hypothetical protein